MQRRTFWNGAIKGKFITLLAPKNDIYKFNEPLSHQHMNQYSLLLQDRVGDDNVQYIAVQKET